MTVQLTIEDRREMEHNAYIIGVAKSQRAPLIPLVSALSIAYGPVSHISHRWSPDEYPQQTTWAETIPGDVLYTVRERRHELFDPGVRLRRVGISYDMQPVPPSKGIPTFLDLCNTNQDMSLVRYERVANLDAPERDDREYTAYPRKVKRGSKDWHSAVTREQIVKRIDHENGTYEYTSVALSKADRSLRAVRLPEGYKEIPLSVAAIYELEGAGLMNGDEGDVKHINGRVGYMLSNTHPFKAKALAPVHITIPDDMNSATAQLLVELYIAKLYKGVGDELMHTRDIIDQIIRRGNCKRMARVIRELFGRRLLVTIAKEWDWSEAYMRKVRDEVQAALTNGTPSNLAGLSGRAHADMRWIQSWVTEKPYSLNIYNLRRRR